MQLSSWGWAHSCSKHVEDSYKRIIEEIVRQVYRLVGWAYMQVRLEFHVQYELHLCWPDETAALFYGHFIQYIGTNTAECGKRNRHGALFGWLILHNENLRTSQFYFEA